MGHNSPFRLLSTTSVGSSEEHQTKTRHHYISRKKTNTFLLFLFTLFGSHAKLQALEKSHDFVYTLNVFVVVNLFMCFICIKPNDVYMCKECIVL